VEDAAERTGEGAGECRLAAAGDVLDQRVPAAEQGARDEFDGAPPPVHDPSMLPTIACACAVCAAAGEAGPSGTGCSGIALTCLLANGHSKAHRRHDPPP
jgi:hypothetical protein